MITRCSNPRHPEYGGRGITVCERWSTSYEAFLEDMGPRPSTDHSLDRIDVNGNYEPSNCRWATRSEQARNTRTSVYVEHAGLRLTLPDWAERLGVPTARLRNRLDAGWPLDRVLTAERASTTPGPRRKKTRPRGTGARAREYRAWLAMTYRCTNPSHQSYPQYGAQGITVCPAWLESFEQFLSDLGPCPPGHQLARVDTSQGYSPENATWMTRSEAMRASRASHPLEYGGQSHSIIEWSELRGIPVETIRSRLRLGWTLARALGFQPHS